MQRCVSAAGPHPSRTTAPASCCTSPTSTSWPTNSPGTAPRCSCTSRRRSGPPCIGAWCRSPPSMPRPIRARKDPIVAERRRTLLGADRTLFMLSVVPYLLDRGAVSVDEVAEHFDVTPELVRRTIALLPMTGIPGESKAYLDNDMFAIDYDALEEGTVILTRNIVIDEAPRFSAREAAALITGLKYLSALPENADSDAISVLLAKLARGSSATPAEMGVETGVPDATRALLRSAASAGTRVAFDYRTS